MHLYIELNTGLTENVNSSVIKKLYELAIGGLDATSDLIGTLHTTVISAKLKAYLEGMFSNLHITADEYSLSFEDPNVENICVTNWGSNGAVTLNQLQAVTSPGAAFKNNTNITKFNEFLYFTGLVNHASTTNLLFSGCTNLEEITLPSNLTYMGSSMFRDCTSLENIIIPASVLTIDSSFIGCTALKAIIATGLTGACRIGGQLNSLTTWQVNSGCTLMSANKCYALKSLTISDTVTTVSLEECMDYNTELTIPASVTSLRIIRCRMKKVIFAQRDSSVTFVAGKDLFASCSSLQTIENFPTNYSYEDPTYIYGGLFVGCSSLTTLIQPPSNCTAIPKKLYEGCSALQGTIEVPATCTSIGMHAFYMCKNLTAVKIYATTPPTLETDGWTFKMAYGADDTKGFDILVPSASLSAYQAISEWSRYGSRLKGF